MPYRSDSYPQSASPLIIIIIIAVVAVRVVVVPPRLLLFSHSQILLARTLHPTAHTDTAHSRKELSSHEYQGKNEVKTGGETRLGSLSPSLALSLAHTDRRAGYVVVRGPVVVVALAALFFDCRLSCNSHLSYTL